MFLISIKQINYLSIYYQQQDKMMFNLCLLVTQLQASSQTVTSTNVKNINRAEHSNFTPLYAIYEEPDKRNLPLDLDKPYKEEKSLLTEIDNPTLYNSNSVEEAVAYSSDNLSRSVMNYESDYSAQTESITKTIHRCPNAFCSLDDLKKYITGSETIDRTHEGNMKKH